MTKENRNRWVNASRRPVNSCNEGPDLFEEGIAQSHERKVDDGGTGVEGDNH